MMKKRGNLLIKLAACAGFLLAMYGIVSQQLQNNKLDQQLEELKAEVEAYSDENDELAYDLSVAGSEEFYLRLAREKLGYHRYGETVFVNDQKR